MDGDDKAMAPIAAVRSRDLDLPRQRLLKVALFVPHVGAVAVDIIGNASPCVALRVKMCSGAGSALLSNLECRAAALGADTIFGDALGTNQEMRGLARKRGYRFSRTPGDWTLVRFSKDIRIAQDIPCIGSSRAVPMLAVAG